MRCNGHPALNSQNNLKMAGFIGESNITKPIFDSLNSIMLKYVKISVYQLIPNSDFFFSSNQHKCSNIYLQLYFNNVGGKN